MDNELDQILAWIDTWLKARRVEDPGRTAKFKLILGVIANNAELLNRLPDELAQKVQAAARAHGVMKEAAS